MEDPGKCRYLSAETEDVYFTDSLLMLNFRKFLYCQLKKDDFENIWFLKCTENDSRIEISCMDKSSKAMCEKKLPKTGILFLKPQTLLEENGQFCIKQDINETGILLESLLNEKHEKFAFVLTRQDYERIFTEKLRKQLADSKFHSELIIIGGASAGDELRQNDPGSSQEYHGETGSETLTEDIFGPKQQMKFLVQRFCLFQMNAPDISGVTVFQNLLADNEFQTRGKKVSLTDFAEYLAGKADDHSDRLAFHTRRELQKRFLADHLFWDYWESYVEE